MIKLTYAKPGDEFDRVTVLGTEAGIFDLWFRLTHANPEFPLHGVETIRITSLDGHAIDLAKGINVSRRYGARPIMTGFIGSGNARGRHTGGLFD